MTDRTHFRGLCTNQFLPESSSGAKCVVCATPKNSVGISNLRGFDAETGALLWEILNFMPFGRSPDGSVYGYRWKVVDTTFGYVAFGIIPTFSTATVFSASTVLQRKLNPSYNGISDGDVWSADCLRVDINGGQHVIMEGVARTMTPIDYAQDLSPPTSTTGIFRQFAVGNRQLYRCSNSGLTLDATTGNTGNQIWIEATDMHRQTRSHTFRLHPRVLFPTGGGTASWVLRSGGTIARFGLYATDVQIRDAVAALPSVESVSVSGGPACQERVDINVTFYAATDQIEDCAVEFANSDIPSASGLTASGVAQIWNLDGHKPVAPTASTILRLGSVSDDMSFASASADSLIASGNWGPLSGLGSPKRAWSKLRWTMPSPGTVPAWGTIDVRDWDVVAFDGMSQTEERNWTPDVFLGGFTLNSVPISRGITAVNAGLIAITSTSCRVAGSGDYMTHLIVRESDGGTVAFGWSGLLNGTNILISDDGEFYTSGSRKGYTSSTNSTPGDNLSSSGYREPTYMEGVSSDASAYVLRETDTRSSFGVGSKLVNILYPMTTNAFDPSPTSVFRSPVLGNSTQRELLGNNWLANTERINSSGAYPFGAAMFDWFQVLSAGSRFNASAEWRLQHGNLSGGTFVATRSTDWFASDVSLAVVKAAVLAWYGSVAFGGRPVVLINVFGDDPSLEGLSPPIPTWQKIENIDLLRGASSTPNATSPLAPNSANCMSLELRNLIPLQTYSLCGLDKSNGLIVWQRDIGLLPTPLFGEVNAGGAPFHFSTNTAVVHTTCRPGEDVPIFSRGDL
jgi:hypothetical protein